MSNNEQAITTFRGAISGYNKDDVNRYIIDLNNDFKKREKEYTDKIAELEKMLKTKSEIKKDPETAAAEAKKDSLISSLRSENETLKKKIASDGSNNAAIAEKDEMIENLKAENELLNESNANYQSAISALTANESELKSVIEKDNAKITELESVIKDQNEKLEEFQNGDASQIIGEMNVKVEEILLYAGEEAERILEEAKIEGLRTKDEISKNTERLKSEIQNKSSTIIDGFRQHKF